MAFFAPITVDLTALEDGKADKVSGATNDHLASLDASGNLKDSGVSADDIASVDISGKADKVVAAVAGHVATLDVDGNLVDGGAALSSKADASSVLLKASNLSDLASAATARTNLGLGTAATAASSDLLARANHTGTQSADTLTDGTTNKAFLATERTKLAGIATGATANSTDAQLRDRSTHTGTQAISTVTGLQTALDAKADDSDLAAYLPLAGGTMSGDVEFANFSLKSVQLLQVSEIDSYSGTPMITVSDSGLLIYGPIDCQGQNVVSVNTLSSGELSTNQISPIDDAFVTMNADLKMNGFILNCTGGNINMNDGNGSGGGNIYMDGGTIDMENGGIGNANVIACTELDAGSNSLNASGLNLVSGAAISSSESVVYFGAPINVIGPAISYFNSGQIDLGGGSIANCAVIDNAGSGVTIGDASGLHMGSSPINGISTARFANGMIIGDDASGIDLFGNYLVDSSSGLVKIRNPIDMGSFGIDMGGGAIVNIGSYGGHWNNDELQLFGLELIMGDGSGAGGGDLHMDNGVLWLGTNISLNEVSTNFQIAGSGSSQITMIGIANVDCGTATIGNFTSFNPATIPTVVGNKAGSDVIGSIIEALVSLGLVLDSTTG